MGRSSRPSRCAVIGLLAFLLLAPGSNTRADGSAPKPGCHPDSCVTGRVVDITDGDTLTLLTSQSSHPTKIRVRLVEIDTPEKDQPWGSHAAQALAQKVYGREVESHVQGWDRYQRQLGHIWLGERDINRELVQEGHAWAYRQYLTDRTLLQDEDAARTSEVGLWSLANPIAPWRWRRGSRTPSASSVSSLVSNAQLDTYTCGSKRYCREMSTCAEASFYLNQCGLTGLDGDGDGTPCEVICR